MKKLLTLLAISIVTLGLYAQVKSRISTRTGIVDQLKTYGRVTYMGQNYYPVGKDSLLVKNDVCKFDSIFIPEILTIDKTPYVVSGFKEMAFEYDVDLKYIEIPISVNEISNSCFYGCSRLSGCKMPGVKTIQGYAFFRTGFERLILPEGLLYIGGSAFTECAELKYLELPQSLTHIGRNAFAGCEMDTVKILCSIPPELDGPVFDIRSSNRKQAYTVLFVPKGCKSKFENSEGWKRFKTIVEY